MRILHVHSGNLFGGVESILLALIRHQALCPEVFFEFALCFRGRLSSALAAASARVDFLPGPRVRRPWTIWRARKQLERLLAENRFDALVVHSCWGQAMFGAVIHAARIPVIFWLHNASTGTHWLDRWARRRPPNQIISVSHFVNETAQRLFPGVPSAVIYSPMTIDERDFQPVNRAEARAEFNTSTEATVIIQLSRLESWKGHEAHLRALAEIKNLPKWICWMVGGAERRKEGSYLSRLRRLAEELGISDQVRFLGRRSDVPRLLLSADLMCQPNQAPEGFSISFMESFYAACPIVTTAIGGAVELIDESCGVLLPAGASQHAALVQALRRLIQDPPLRARLGQSGRARLLKLCDPKKQMEKICALLKSAANRIHA